MEWFSASAAVVMIPLPRQDPVYFSSFSSILFTWASPSGLSPVPQTHQPPFSLRDLHLLFFPWIFTCLASPWHLGLSLNVSLAETLSLTILSKEATPYPPITLSFPVLSVFSSSYYHLKVSSIFGYQNVGGTWPVLSTAGTLAHGKHSESLC